MDIPNKYSALLILLELYSTYVDEISNWKWMDQTFSFSTIEEHSMARANLNKSEVFLKNTNTASKYLHSCFLWSKTCFTMFTFRGTYIYYICKFGPERQNFNWCRFVNTKKWKNEVRVKSLLWGNIFFTTEVEVWVKARISCIYWVQGVRFLLQLLLIMSTYCKSHTTRFLLSLCHLKQEEEEHRGALWFSRICISI